MEIRFSQRIEMSYLKQKFVSSYLFNLLQVKLGLLGEEREKKEDF